MCLANYIYSSDERERVWSVAQYANVCFNISRISLALTAAMSPRRQPPTPASPYLTYLSFTASYHEHYQ